MEKIALKIVEKLQGAGHVAYFAGGCVRDQLLGNAPKDFDIATDALPEQVESLFENTIPLGKAFGVICVIEQGLQFEVATFRTEGGYQDGRRPTEIEFCGAQADAVRRDFTINGMFFDPVSEELIDYVSGQEDLRAGIVRAIGDPDERFGEDHLRMLRAVRFAHRLGFELEAQTADSIRRNANLISKISVERIESELSRTWTESARAGDALTQLRELGLLKVVLPEIEALSGVEQPPEWHPEGDVFVHTVIMLNMMDSPSDDLARDLAWALLLHDVGKPSTYFEEKTGRIRFFGHESKGAEMAQVILERLRFSNKSVARITHAVRNHMRFSAVLEMRKATLRKMVGHPDFALELELHRCDCWSSHKKMGCYEFLGEFMEQMKDEPILPKPWISGCDLIALGLEPGPTFGKLLNGCYCRQIDGDAESKEALVAWLKNTLGDPLKPLTDEG